MSRQDPGAATGQPIREPQRCRCGHLESLHLPVRHRRGCCNASVAVSYRRFDRCPCERFEVAS